jgi:hypothetical protein
MPQEAASVPQLPLFVSDFSAAQKVLARYEAIRPVQTKAHRDRLCWFMRGSHLQCHGRTCHRGHGLSRSGLRTLYARPLFRTFLN